MLFTDLSFLVFFLAYIFLHFATRGGARLWVCLLGSYVFYGWWDWRFLFLIGLLTVSNFWFGLKIGSEGNQRTRKSYVVASVVLSLSILAYFKYANFFLESLVNLGQVLGLQLNTSTLRIILPVGISFYTFQTMSYTLDLYRGKVDTEYSLLRFAVFVAFFPQLVAGPIVRASIFLPQLREDRPLVWERVLGGLSLVLWGYVLKSALADSLAPVVEARFDYPAAHSSGSLAVGIIFYAFQIYGDFAGYSLIAIGLARIMHFDFDKNFDRPYFSAGFSEFWRRWHISLSSWLRDYLYIPLGGNRKGPIRTYVNLMLTMLLGGLWHGAAWTFVFWGFLHGLYLCGQRLATSAFRRVHIPVPWIGQVGRLAAIPLVFLLVCLAWIFFRSASFSDALLYIDRIFTSGNFSFAAVTQKFEVIKGFALVAIVGAADALSMCIPFQEVADKRVWLHGIFIVTCMLGLALFGTFGSNAFIYFQF